jgi:hypothetical protein
LNLVPFCLFHEWRGNQGKRAKVDAPVKDHVDPLVCDGRINNGTFPGLLDLDGHLATLILIGDQGCDIGLDATGTEANNDNGCDGLCQYSASVYTRELQMALPAM